VTLSGVLALFLLLNIMIYNSPACLKKNMKKDRWLPASPSYAFPFFDFLLYLLRDPSCSHRSIAE
jgi:hypothetical protein